jgi:hypothetical protein
MKACWFVAGVSLRCLVVVPANGLKLPVTGDSRQDLWPNPDQEQKYKDTFIEWQKREIEKHGAREGPQCYKGCCGLGHRNKRTFGQAFQAWTHGQPLNVGWPPCKGVNSWTLLHDEEVMHKYSQWIGAGLHTQECQFNVSNEPVFDEDVKSTLELFFNANEEHRLQHPAAKWYYALQQIGFKYSPLGSIAARFLQQEFQGHAVIGVHLRLGNGEEAATIANRTPTIPRHDVFRYVSQTADRIAKEVLNISANSIRVFVASDDHHALEEFQRFVPRVFFFTGGNWIQEGQGVATDVMNQDVQDEGCADLERTVMSEAVLLVYADVLLTLQ